MARPTAGRRRYSGARGELPDRTDPGAEHVTCSLPPAAPLPDISVPRLVMGGPARTAKCRDHTRGALRQTLRYTAER